MQDKKGMATVAEAVARGWGVAAVSEAVPPMVEVVREIAPRRASRAEQMTTASEAVPLKEKTAGEAVGCRRLTRRRVERELRTKRRARRVVAREKAL